MKYNFKLKSLKYCNVENTISKDSVLVFKDIDEVVNYVKNRNLYFSEDRLYYGDYFLDIDFTTDEKDLIKYIKYYIEDIEKFEESKEIDVKMKKEFRLFEWQADIVRDDSKIIMANISRQGSKTFLLANKVMYEKPKTVLYINSNMGQLRILKDHFEEIFALDDTIRESIRYYNFSRKKLFIEFDTGETITICDKDERFDEDEIIDLVLFDDGLPQLDIKAKKYVSVFTIKHPIMNLFNCRKDISYHVIGIKKLIESGYLTREQIVDTKKHIGDLMFDKEFDLCNEYKEMFDEKPIRGQRRNANLYEESAGDINFTNTIDFKGAIMQEQKVKNKRVKEYNDIIKENLQNIKDLFISEEFKVTTQRKTNRSFSLIVIKETETMKIERKFNCFNELEKIMTINKGEVDLKSFVENKLKDFIVRKALEYDLKLKYNNVILIVTKNDNIKEIFEDISCRCQFDKSTIDASNYSYATATLTYSGAKIKIRKFDDKFTRRNLGCTGRVVLCYGDFTEDEINTILTPMSIETGKVQRFIIGMDMFEL